MIAEELINHMVPPLKPTDDAHKAVIWMEELRCSQLPVVDKTEFIGLISEEIILENNNIDKLVGEYDLIGKDCFTSLNSHFYDILKLATDNNVSTIAVMDDEGKYSGAITVNDTVAAFAQSSAIQIPGGILVLSMNIRDYSLAEISRLVEENNCKIIASSIKFEEDPNKIRLTIKLNTLEMERVVATLERFDYKIIARFRETKVSTGEQEKIDMLFRYLEI